MTANINIRLYFFTNDLQSQFIIHSLNVVKNMYIHNGIKKLI